MSVSTGTRKERTVQSRATESIIEADKAFIAGLKPFSDPNSLSGDAGSAINNSPKTPAGNYLAREGDSMIGPIALGPPPDFTIEVDANNTIDIGPLNDNPQYSSNIQLDNLQPNSSVIDIIANAAFDGQIVILRTVAPTVSYTISQGTIGNGGNIQTGNSNDFIMGDLQTMVLVFDASLIINANTGGTWRVVSVSAATGGGSGNVPNGTANKDHLEWNGAAWVAQQNLDFDNNTPALRFRTFADTSDIIMVATTGNNLRIERGDLMNTGLEISSDSLTTPELFTIRQFNTGPGTVIIDTSGTIMEFNVNSLLQMSITEDAINTENPVIFTAANGLAASEIGIGSNFVGVLEMNAPTRVEVAVNGVSHVSYGVSSWGTQINENYRLFLSSDGTNAPVNLEPTAGDPTTINLDNGDIWYNSTTNKFRARENGVSVDVIGGGGEVFVWSAPHDANGNEFILSPDGNTSIVTSANDVIGFTINSVVNALRFTENGGSGAIEWVVPGFGHSISATSTSLEFGVGTNTDSYILNYVSASKQTIFTDNHIDSRSDEAAWFVESSYSPATPADGNVFALYQWGFKNSIGTLEPWAEMRMTATEVDNGDEDSDIDFFVFDGGVFRNIIRLDGSTNELLMAESGDVDLNGGGLERIGSFDWLTTPIVTGSRAGNAALTSLLSQLDANGIIDDQTTA